MKFFKGLGWREWLLFVFPLALLAVLVFLYQMGLRRLDSVRRTSCQANIKQVNLGLLQYSKDYDEKFPLVVGGLGIADGHLPAPGWAMTLQPYLKSTSIFRCPGDSNPGPSDWSPRKNGFMSFYLNSNLAGQKKSVLLFSRSTILLGDGSNGKDISDATYSKSSLPPEWIADPNSPAWRHLNGANYLMADGSVHWLRPNEVTTFGGRKNAFAIR